MPGLTSLLKILTNFIALLYFSSCSLIGYLAIRSTTGSYFVAYSGIRAFGALITTTS
jgi:hypothetical protein